VIIVSKQATSEDHSIKFIERFKKYAHGQLPNIITLILRIN
jgi:hypothetical protein